jgi:hypothetical protein
MQLLQVYSLQGREDEDFVEEDESGRIRLEVGSSLSFASATERDAWHAGNPEDARRSIVRG